MGYVKTFSVFLNEEREKILKEFDQLRWKDHYSNGQIIMEAIKEYVAKHTPGNPQTPLDIYNSLDTPPPKEQETELRKLIKQADEEYLASREA